jgi:hypothetical protein
MIYLNGTFITNVSKDVEHYNATGLTPDTNYTISTHTIDTSGNINNIWVNDSATTEYDSTPPLSIIGLDDSTIGQTYINWTWTDPSDSDFSDVMIYLNGTFMTNVSKDVEHYNATGLTPDTNYTISTHTIDTSGNINNTWINHTSCTPLIPPSPTSSTKSKYRGHGTGLFFTVQTDTPTPTPTPTAIVSSMTPEPTEPMGFGVQVEEKKKIYPWLLLLILMLAIHISAINIIEKYAQKTDTS